MNTWGHNIRLSIFGESHGAAVGITIDGLPPGLPLDFDFINAEMARRAPGRSELATARLESDEVEILSGIFEGKATGTPLCAVIGNNNTRSGDYEPSLLRPGHADYAGLVKYRGFSDYRGGGHFSGRLTAPLVFAGAVAKLALVRFGVKIEANILKIAGEADENAMRQAVLNAKEAGDSVGGVIECVAENVPAGLGEPFFGSVESELAALLFSIPAVKGVEFGDGFAMADMAGSEANDAFYMDGALIKTRTNHNGGINGGITNGMPIVFRVAVKPTPSIALEQNTVNAAAVQNAKIKVSGRHDPCIVYRALPVVEAVGALVLLDAFGGAAAV